MIPLLPNKITLNSNKESNVSIVSSSDTINTANRTGAGTVTFTYTYDNTECKTLNYALNLNVSIVDNSIGYDVDWSIDSYYGSPEVSSCHVLVKANSPITSDDSTYSSDIICHSVNYPGHNVTLSYTSNTIKAKQYYAGFLELANLIHSDVSGEITFTVSIRPIKIDVPDSTVTSKQPSRAVWTEKYSGYEGYSNYNTLVYNTGLDSNSERIWKVGGASALPTLTTTTSRSNFKYWNFTLPAGTYKVSLAYNFMSSGKINQNFVGFFKKSDILPESSGGDVQLVSFTYNDKSKALLCINESGTVSSTLSSTYKDSNNLDCVTITSTGEEYTVLYYQSYYSSPSNMFTNSVSNLTCAAYISKHLSHKVTEMSDSGTISEIPFNVNSSNLTLVNKEGTVSSLIKHGYYINVGDTTLTDPGLTISINKKDRKKLSDIISYSLSGETKNYASTATFSNTLTDSAFIINTRTLAYIYKGGKLVPIKDMYVVDSSKNLADTTTDKFDEIKDSMSYIGDA